MPGGTKKQKNKTKLARTAKELKEERGLKKPSKVKLAVRVKKESLGEEKPLKKEKRIEKKVTKKEIEIAEKTIIKNSFPRETKESVNWEQTERSKRMIMWSGVTFFMVLIGVAWIFNTKMVIKKNQLENDSSFSWDELSKITDDISEEIEQMKEGVAELKEFGNLAATSTEMSGLPESESASSSLFTVSTLEQEQVDEIKEKLETIKKEAEE